MYSPLFLYICSLSKTLDPKDFHCVWNYSVRILWSLEISWSLICYSSWVPCSIELSRGLSQWQSCFDWEGFLISFTAKNMVFTRSENKLWILENAALFTHFLTFSEKKIQRSPVVFESANWSIRSIIQQFSSTVNSMKTIVFLVLRVRLTDGKTVCIPLFTGVFPVTKHCFHRSFPLKTMRFLPFSRTVNA